MLSNPAPYSWNDSARNIRHGTDMYSYDMPWDTTAAIKDLPEGKKYLYE